MTAHFNLFVLRKINRMDYETEYGDMSKVSKKISAVYRKAISIYSSHAIFFVSLTALFAFFSAMFTLGGSRAYQRLWALLTLLCTVVTIVFLCVQAVSQCDAKPSS